MNHTVIAHSDSSDEEAIIYTDEKLEMAHAEEPQSEEEEEKMPEKEIIMPSYSTQQQGSYQPPVNNPQSSYQPTYYSSSPAPVSLRRCVSSPQVSCSPIVVFSWSSMSPVSIPASIIMVVTPASRSPLMIA